MKLVNMKIKKKSKKELKEMDIPMAYGDGDKWPYGLEVRFEKEQIEKLPILKKFDVGDRVYVYAEATVKGIRISERSNGHKDHYVELQLESINVEPKTKKKVSDMSPKEYKEMRMGGV